MYITFHAPVCLHHSQQSDYKLETTHATGIECVFLSSYPESDEKISIIFISVCIEQCRSMCVTQLNTKTRNGENASLYQRWKNTPYNSSKATKSYLHVVSCAFFIHSVFLAIVQFQSNLMNMRLVHGLQSVTYKLFLIYQQDYIICLVLSKTITNHR